MKDLIKAIRTAANMNQEQFASSLGTTPLSINRWENGKTLPNRMAQTQLYNFCKERSIDVAKLIVDTKAYADADNKLILYHGSKKELPGMLHRSAARNVISVAVSIWEPVRFNR